MASVKIFGSRKGGAPKKEKTKCSLGLRIAKIVLIVLLALEGVYFFFSYSQIPIIAKARYICIETAMSTMRNQWMATKIFPKKVVDDVMSKVYAAQQNQMGASSTWEDEKKPEENQYTFKATAEQDFYEQFWQLDKKTMREYLLDHPEAVDNGWENVYINEAGLDDEGTSIKTTAGDQVLGIDAVNGVLLIRVTGPSYRGVLAIASEPARLSVQPSSKVGSDGELAGTIAERHNGVLAMTGSGFIDMDANGNMGRGNGGIIAGYAMCNGKEYGRHMGYGYKRVELHEDNLLYIRDAQSAVSEKTTDAVEFTPALIIDGEIIVDENCGWNAINPRACIGQSSRREIMMLMIEGRQITSLGTGVVECAAILARYDCMQAMNLDGGTSAILWYDGECVTKCSNESCPEGRTLPDVFVYERKSAADSASTEE